MAVPLIFWGVAILMAGGTSIAALKTYRDEDIDFGKIDLPDVLSGGPKPEPEPERKLPDGLTSSAARDALKELVRTQRQLKKRCQDQEEQNCPYCKPATDGKATVPWHTFQGGTVRKPSPRARGSLYQHYVLPWHGFSANETDGQLKVSIEEWEWKRGRDGSWDGLDYAKCKLYECKLGYRDYLDESKIGDSTKKAYRFPNPEKPFLGTLQNVWKKQITSQHNAFSPEWPTVTLEWVFSDQEVMWQFLGILDELRIANIEIDHIPYHLAPDGTNFVSELYASGEQDYGYWEDN